MFRIAIALSVCALAPCLGAAVPRGCVASAPLANFQLSVKPPTGGAARPIRQVNVIEKGYKLVYAPREIPQESERKARVALVLGPVDRNAKLTVVETEEANQPAEWTAPFRVGVVAVVFGPQGLDHKKVESLVAKDGELIAQLADYAEQTAQVEALINSLSEAERGSRSVDAALSGFAAQSGAVIPKLDRTASTDQQAMALMRALNPAIGSYDPLAPQSAARMQQSAGTAASVASLFFGTNVGLAAGGAAMVQNMRSLLFPGTDFRSALAQKAANDDLTLCAKRQAAKSRTRLAYLWAYRVPDAAAPIVSLEKPAHLPLGVVSTVAVKPKAAADWAALPRAYDWTLEAADGKSVAVPVKAAAGGQALEIDLKSAKAAPGRYRLKGKWDWSSFEVPGEVHLYAMPELKTMAIDRASGDRLVEGAAAVKLKVTGADFQFVEKVTLDKQPVEFTLPDGPRAGPQGNITATIDTARFRAGQHLMAMYTPDGRAFEMPVRVLPPNPAIENTPVRVNMGEKEQAVLLRGSGLDRIQKIDSPLGEVELGAAARDGRSREVIVRLGAGTTKGQRGPFSLKVEGMEAPLEVPDVLSVAGPRPKIAAVDASLPEDIGTTLRSGELPAGALASFAIKVADIEGQPTVHLVCGADEKTLRPGERAGTARLDAAGPEMLFLSLDPSSLGRSGCTMMATVEAGTGKSDAQKLGRVVRLPRIDGFALTDEKVGEGSYAGVLTGRDLETIDRAGWDAKTGQPVAGLPKAIDSDRQSLRVVLPWPAPSPHAPVYIWLRGEAEGRMTRAKL